MRESDVGEEKNVDHPGGGKKKKKIKKFEGGGKGERKILSTA